MSNDLAKLSNVVKTDVAKKTEYNKLKNKVDIIDTSGFTRTKFTTDTNALDDNIIIIFCFNTQFFWFKIK